MKRELYNANITAVPINNGVSWGKVPYNIMGHTELLQIPYVIHISIEDFITKNYFSDDWDSQTIHNIIVDLEAYTTFQEDDPYLNAFNYNDMYC